MADELIENAKEKNWDLNFEFAIKMAVEIQRNNIIEDAFGISIENEPAFLEAIAIQLGYNGTGKTHSNLVEAILAHADAIERSGA